MRTTATVLMLALAALPSSIAANDGGEVDRPVRLFATAPGPAGFVSSFGSVRMNGRPLLGTEALWGGELIEATSGSHAHVRMDSIGEIFVSGGVARISTTDAVSTEPGGRKLVASVLSGEMRVKLDPNAGAFVQSRGKTFDAGHGSDFRVAVTRARSVLTTYSGTVAEQTQQRRYILRPYDSGLNLSVRARSTRQIQVQVTDENDQPIPDIPIIFALATRGQAFGTLGSGSAAGSTSTVTTNAQGIAGTSFNAGADAGSSEVTATIEGTDIAITFNVSVLAKTGFWTTRNTLLILAAAGAGIAIAIATSGGEEEFRPIPPPQVRP